MSEAVPRTLRLWLLRGEWATQPLRNLIALLAIAVGVALGFAIYLINAAAFSEFSAAVRSLSGQADLQLHAAQPQFDENIYSRVAADSAVAVASPVLELDLLPAGAEKPLKVLGIDVLQAAEVTPELIGAADQNSLFDTLADDAIFLSPAALEWLGLKRGTQLALRSGTRTVTLRVAGGLTAALPGQRLAVMDIGAMQWHFERSGWLSRIDLRLKPGVERDAFAARMKAALGPQFHLSHGAQQETRAATMSRAYRVNLNMLALVALFTGAFLVFSGQALSVIRRRSQLALLRVLGLTRGQMLRQILSEGLLLGALGSLLGLAGGYAMAALALRLFGGDLGGGYFPGLQPQVMFPPLAGLVFFLLGTATALLGCAAPAWQAASTRPAAALKSAGSDATLGRLASPWPGLALLLLGALCTRLPPLFALPVFGYLAIAMLLVGAILLMPRAASLVFRALSRPARRTVPTLALAHLANAPNQASIALGGVLTSFSLMVAMAIMVASFRVSVDNWLTQVLAADLYVRTAGPDATLDRQEQQRIAGIAGVMRADFQRNASLTLDPARPEVALLARGIDAADPGRTLPLMGPSLRTSELPADAVPVWISEAMVDLYDYRPGMRIRLPLGPDAQDFVVAGVWRDYVRQTGAIQIRLADYRKLTGDETANEVALWMQANHSATEAIDALRALPFGAALAFFQPSEIRAISLRVFDRSFAVTYLLEAVAILIGLFGIAASFSAQTLARAKEFGMLRHVGLTRRQVLATLAIEGGLLALLGVLLGLLLGMAISLILVFVVNPQSFHWTMEWHPPWPGLAVVAAALLASATLTALLAGRKAVAGDAVRMVREDW